MVDVVVPSDDSEIQQALAELDERLSTWSAAMREATAALRSAAEALPTPADPAPAPAPEPVEPPVAAAVVEEAPPVEELVEQAPAGEQVEAGPPPATPEPAAPKQKAGIRVLVPVEAPADAPEEKPAAVDDDEAVLASVDEKTAQALRVMRRLSPVKKSFRQLLEEYQREQETRKEPEPQQSKSWWRRK